LWGRGKAGKNRGNRARYCTVTKKKAKEIEKLLDSSVKTSKKRRKPTKKRLEEKKKEEGSKREEGRRG